MHRKFASRRYSSSFSIRSLFSQCCADQCTSHTPLSGTEGKKKPSSFCIHITVKIVQKIVTLFSELYFLLETRSIDHFICSLNRKS